jgi:hypothetical protein
MKRIFSERLSVHNSRVIKALFILSAYFVISLFLHSQNYCLRFYGNGTGDIDRVKIPIDNPANPMDVGGSFTIEFQIKALLADNPQGTSVFSGTHDDWVMGHVIVDRDIFGPGDYGDYGISLCGGRIAFGVNNGNQGYTVVSNTSVADGVWHFVAVTRNALNGELQIFIDGTLDVSEISPVIGDISYRDSRPTTWPNDPFIVLGAEKHDYDNATYPSFNGFLDELRISTGILYSGNYTPLPALMDGPGTVGLFHFDEGSGLTAYNSAASGAGVHGFLQVGGTPAGPEWVLRENVGLLSHEPSHWEIKTVPGGFYISSSELQYNNTNNLKIWSLSGKLLMVYSRVVFPHFVPYEGPPQWLVAEIENSFPRRLLFYGQ